MSNDGHEKRRVAWPLVSGVALLGLTGLALMAVGILRFVGRAEKPLPVYGQIADFALTDQNGHKVSLGNLHGHVWVADVIFTRCAGSCPKMTSQMKELQDALAGDSQTRLVSLTTDPDYDTPAVMKAYAERFGADPARWMFLTGTKAELAKLAVSSLKLSAVPKEPGDRTSPDDLFIHSTIFVVADKHGQLRGVFETTGDGIDPAQVQAKILGAVKQLEGES